MQIYIYIYIHSIYQVNPQSGSVGSTCHVFFGVSLYSVVNQSFINLTQTAVRKQRSFRSEMRNFIGGESETIISPQWWRSIHAQKVFSRQSRVQTAFQKDGLCNE